MNEYVGSFGCCEEDTDDGWDVVSVENSLLGHVWRWEVAIFEVVQIHVVWIVSHIDVFAGIKPGSVDAEGGSKGGNHRWPSEVGGSDRFHHFFFLIIDYFNLEFLNGESSFQFENTPTLDSGQSGSELFFVFYSALGTWGHQLAQQLPFDFFDRRRFCFPTGQVRLP